MIKMGISFVIEKGRNKHDSDQESRPVRRNPGHRLRSGAEVVRTAAGLSPPTFLPHDTEAVWELAEHRYVYIVQQPEHAGHAMHTIFLDEFDAVVAQIADRGLDPVEAGNLLERRAQDYVPRSRRKRDRVRRRSAVTSFR